MTEVLGPELAKQIGVIPLHDSTFGLLNLCVTGGLLVLGPLLFMALCPAQGADPSPAPPPDLAEPPEVTEPTRVPKIIKRKIPIATVPAIA